MDGPPRSHLYPLAVTNRVGAATRQWIVEATRDLLAEGGLEAATVKAICDRAGILPGSFYNQFESKEEAVFTIIREAITAVDPDRMDLLFERFVSAARGEPPDIDVDFEHERREEVTQYVYEKYGRERAGIAATVISYRGRSAIREVGKALGLSADVVGALANQLWGFAREGTSEAQVREIGLDPKDAAGWPRATQRFNAVPEMRMPPEVARYLAGEYLPGLRQLETNPLLPDRTFVTAWRRNAEQLLAS